MPPILHALKTLGGGLTDDLVPRFLSVPQTHREPVRCIEFRPNYICFPVRTPTRPPATHTNCYLIYTSEQLLVIDPGSPFADEQEALHLATKQLLDEGRQLHSVLLTHVHPDHVGGVNALRDFFSNVNISAHSETARALSPDIKVDQILCDGDAVRLAGEPRIELNVLHTPGHARGHLCLHDDRTGTLISGDNIVGLGSVLIDPPEGNMSIYLSSLGRMRSLSNLSVILGGHGPAIANPYEKIDEYITHRLDREAKILAAVENGAATASEVVTIVYTDVSPKAHGMAERAVLAHLEKLETDGLVEHSGLGWTRTDAAKPVV